MDADDATMRCRRPSARSTQPRTLAGSGTRHTEDCWCGLGAAGRQGNSAQRRALGHNRHVPHSPVPECALRSAHPVSIPMPAELGPHLPALPGGMPEPLPKQEARTRWSTGKERADGNGSGSADWPQNQSWECLVLGLRWSGCGGAGGAERGLGCRIHLRPVPRQISRARRRCLGTASPGLPAGPGRSGRCPPSSG